MMAPVTASVLLVGAEDRLPNSGVANANRRYRFPGVSIASRRLPAEVPDGHVRVQMLYAGLCGTDLHLVQSDPDSGFVLTSAPASIPLEGRVLGHEGVGRVIGVGKAVRSIGDGDVVSFASILACMHCDICRRGNFNQCRESRLLGSEIDGIFGTTVDVPALLAHDVSGMIRSEDDLRSAACIEPAGVALQACESARVGPGDTVVIFGGGPIGIYSAMLCKGVYGAGRVELVEPVVVRRDIARKWCDCVYDVEEYFSSVESSVDVVLECSGELQNLESVFERIDPNGRVVVLGRSGKPLRISATDHMITQGISVAGCRGHLGGALGKVIAVYRAGMLPLSEVITKELASLEELAIALSRPERLVEEHCKVLIGFAAARATD